MTRTFIYVDKNGLRHQFWVGRYLFMRQDEVRKVMVVEAGGGSAEKTSESPLVHLYKASDS